MNVKEYQHHLAALGYHAGNCDGIYGPVTKSSIMKFQKEHRNRPDGTTLWVDGIWGPATEAALRQAISTDEPSQVEKPDLPNLPTGNIEKAIYEALAHHFPTAAVAGIMGNLCAESALRPNNMEDQYQSKLGFNDKSYTKAVDDGSYTNFAHDAVGYGLAQWTWHTRKQALLDFAKASEQSIADPGVQIAFLLSELHQQFPILEKQLQNKNISVYQATRLFMVSYENPADKSDAAISARVALAQKYYNRYA